MDYKESFKDENSEKQIITDERSMAQFTIMCSIFAVVIIQLIALCKNFSNTERIYSNYNLDEIPMYHFISRLTYKAEFYLWTMLIFIIIFVLCYCFMLTKINTKLIKLVSKVYEMTLILIVLSVIMLFVDTIIGYPFSYSGINRVLYRLVLKTFVILITTAFAWKIFKNKPKKTYIFLVVLIGLISFGVNEFIIKYDDFMSSYMNIKVNNYLVNKDQRFYEIKIDTKSEFDKVKINVYNNEKNLIDDNIMIFDNFDSTIAIIDFGKPQYKSGIYVIEVIKEYYVSSNDNGYTADKAEIVRKFDVLRE